MIRWLLLPPSALLIVAAVWAFGGFVVQLAERGERVRVDARLASLFVRETAARALFVALAPFGGEGMPRRAPPPPGEGPLRNTPVLLVAERGVPVAALGFLRTFLSRRGWIWVWPVDLRADRTLADQAAHLGTRVDALRSASGHDQVDVVGFSLGGLAAAWYVRHLEGAPKVRRLVTIGTPWRGTRTAVFGRSRASREILPGSHALDDLAPPPVPTLCVWSPDDPAVVPAASAVPTSGAEAVRVDAAGHAEMLMSARVFRAVEAALTHPALVEPSGSAALTDAQRSS